VIEAESKLILTDLCIYYLMAYDGLKLRFIIKFYNSDKNLATCQFGDKGLFASNLMNYSKMDLIWDMG